MVLPEITVISVTVITLVMHLVGKVITLNITTENALLSALNIVKTTSSDRLCAYSSPNSRRRKLKITNSYTQIQCQ